MFISATIVTDSHLSITRTYRFPFPRIRKTSTYGFLKYKVSKTYLSYNGKTKLVDLEILPSKLKSS